MIDIKNVEIPETLSDLDRLLVAAGMYDEADQELGLIAETLNDIENARIAASNRDFQYRSSLPTDLPSPLAGVLAGLAEVEKEATKRLEKAMRVHPLGPWVKAQRGIGDKQAARLLAAIGNPYVKTVRATLPDGAPDDDLPDVHIPRRGPAELWAYCGYSVLHPSDDRDGPDALGPRVVAGVAPRRRKGQKANWNAAARMRAYLVAESCMKQAKGSKYRDVYDFGRAKYDRPDLSLIVQHKRALRLVAKAVLRDLFLEAKRWHYEQAGLRPESCTPKAIDCVS